MTRATLLHLLAHPTTLGGADVRALEELAEAFPYCQTAHLLLAKAAHDHDSMLAAQRLRRAATYATDRAQLRRLIELPAPVASPTLVAAETAPELPEAPPAPAELPAAPPAAVATELIDQPGQELAPQPTAPAGEALAAPLLATVPAAEAALISDIIADTEVVNDWEASAATEVPPAVAASDEPAAPDTQADPVAARPSQEAAGDEATATPAQPVVSAEVGSSALTELATPTHDTPAPTEITPPTGPVDTASLPTASELPATAPAETTPPIHVSAAAPLVEAVAPEVADEPTAASDQVASLAEPDFEVSSLDAVADTPETVPELATAGVEVVPETAAPTAIAEANEFAIAATPEAEVAAETTSTAPAFGTAVSGETEAAPNEELPAQAPPVRLPAEAAAARHEFGLVPAEPVEAPMYELPELAITIPLTLAYATPLLPPFGGLAGVGYIPEEGSRLGYCLVATEADGEQPAGHALPPVGEFFAPDAAVLLHIAEHQPPTPPRPNSLQLIDSFLRRTPSVTRRRGTPAAGTSEQADLSMRSTRTEPDLASESLATILAKQGKLDKAIVVYERLIVKYPEKMAYFAAQIESLRLGA